MCSRPFEGTLTGVKPRVLRKAAQEVAVLAVSPIHHGGDAEPTRAGRARPKAGWIQRCSEWHNVSPGPGISCHRRGAGSGGPQPLQKAAAGGYRQADRYAGTHAPDGSHLQQARQRQYAPCRLPFPRLICLLQASSGSQRPRLHHRMLPEAP